MCVCILGVRNRSLARSRAPTEGNTEGREEGSKGAEGKRRAVGTEENVSRIPPLPTVSPAPSKRHTQSRKHARARAQHSKRGHTKEIRETNVGPRDRFVTTHTLYVCVYIYIASSLLKHTTLSILSFFLSENIHTYARLVSFSLYRSLTPLSLLPRSLFERRSCAYLPREQLRRKLLSFSLFRERDPRVVAAKTSPHSFRQRLTIERDADLHTLPPLCQRMSKKS